MGENTGVEWAHHTFNPWWGCWKIDKECELCYAAALDGWLKGGEFWGRTAPRRFFGDDHWRKPLAWNRAAAKAGERHRAFCGSMCDWAERHPEIEVNARMDAERARLGELIEVTLNLDWLMLTKRPENAVEMVPRRWLTGAPQPNVWLGTTVGHQGAVSRMRPVLEAPFPAVRFISYEPALERVDFGDDLRHFDWLIVGAERGHGARPMDEQWVRYARDQAEAAGVTFFYKQATDPKRKGRVISLPVLDGRQHVAWPDA